MSVRGAWEGIVVRITRDRHSGSSFIARKGTDWPLALPAKVASWQKESVWTLFGCFAPCLLILVILLAVNNHDAALWLLLIPTIIVPIRMARVGMIVTDKDVTIVGYLHNRIFPREQFSRFDTTIVRKRFGSPSR